MDQKLNTLKPESLKQRLGTLFVGILGNKILDHVFNNFLYPFVIWQKGPFVGGLIMTFASLVTCLLLIWFYDWAKKDWLMIETAKEKKVASGRFLSWALKQSDPVLFVVLSIWTDPFITTIAMRQGHWQFNGMFKRDWKIFFGSLLIGNLEWIIVLTGGIWVVTEKLWPWMKPVVDQLLIHG
jgi:hypothetical protein